VSSVAQNNELTDEEVWSMVKHISKKKIKIDLCQLKRLGIDEIALKKVKDNTSSSWSTWIQINQ